MSPPPGHSRGGPLTTDRPTAESPGEKLTSEPMRKARQNATARAEIRQVFAHAVQVRGTRGRDRLLLFVSCWLCGRTHQHGAKFEFTAGRRTAACGLGKYLLLVAAVEGRLAA